MRTKARGQAQHGGPPGWLEESDPGGCDFVRVGRSHDGPYRLLELLSCELFFAGKNKNARSCVSLPLSVVEGVHGVHKILGFDYL
jgi:hypothetical protein